MRATRLFLLPMLALGLLVADAPRPAPPAPSPPAKVETSRYALANFGTVSVYRPDREPAGVVLVLSDRDGWTPARDRMARALAGRGLLVAGVATPVLLQAMEASPKACDNPNYPLIDLSRDLQHRVAVRSYHKPVVLGIGTGATLAYAGIAQWANAGYQGAISINPAHSLPGRKPWCAAPGFLPHRVTKPQHGWRFVANRQIGVPWVVVQQRPGAMADRRALTALVAAVPHASLIDLPGNGTERAGDEQLIARTAGAVAALLPPPIPGPVAGDVTLPDMPLTLVAAAPGKTSDMMAIAYSGDGGWVGIDRDLSAQIAAAGIPVVGVDSLSYFWSARSPAGAASDLSRLIRGFGTRWGKRRVVLVGYSFGADVMPHMIDHLDPEARSRIASVALLGLSSTADFQFHLTSWINMDSANAMPTIPAIAKLRGMTIRCVRGDQENDSACPAIPAGLAQQYVVPGGHHFDRNAVLLGQIVLGQRKAGVIR